MHLLRTLWRRDEGPLSQLRRRARGAAAPAQAGMNYRHAYHAGNFADVHKHVALVAALLHLRKKETPFAVIDTHAGRGLYDIASEAASRTGEAAQGITRLAGLAPQDPALKTYLEIAGSFGAGCYPGSPLIAAKLLRGQDRLAAIEKHPEEFAALKRSLAPFHRGEFLGMFLDRSEEHTSEIHSRFGNL